VRFAARGTLARKAHDAAIADDGLDPRHAQLHRLLDDPVHLVRLGQALDEPHAKPRLRVHVAVRAHLHLDAVLVDALDRGVVLAATPVEHRDGVAGLQAQRASHVLRRLGRERELGAGTEALVAVDARQGHGAMLPVRSSCKRR
jgi:hypothetical protein